MAPDRDNQDPRESGQTRRAAKPAPVDLQALAERVYRLMLADLRLERARGATTGRKER